MCGTHLGLSCREPFQPRACALRIDPRERARERRENARIFSRTDRLEERAHEALLRREPLLEEPDRARSRVGERAPERRCRREADLFACRVLLVHDDARETLEPPLSIPPSRTSDSMASERKASLFASSTPTRSGRARTPQSAVIARSAAMPIEGLSRRTKRTMRLAGLIGAHLRQRAEQVLGERFLLTSRERNERLQARRGSRAALPDPAREGSARTGSAARGRSCASSAARGARALRPAPTAREAPRARHAGIRFRIDELIDDRVDDRGIAERAQRSLGIVALFRAELWVGHPRFGSTPRVAPGLEVVRDEGRLHRLAERRVREKLRMRSSMPCIRPSDSAVAVKKSLALTSVRRETRRWRPELSSHASSMRSRSSARSSRASWWRLRDPSGAPSG